MVQHFYKGFYVASSQKERKIQHGYRDSFWTEKVAFFSDAVSFVHKFNSADQAQAPQECIWKKETEGLVCECTAKGSHCGTGGRVAKNDEAISYGKEVILCEQYIEMNGQNFKGLVDNFSPRKKLITLLFSLDTNYNNTFSKYHIHQDMLSTFLRKINSNKTVTSFIACTSATPPHTPNIPSLFYSPHIF